jgi:hypothetical protein
MKVSGEQLKDIVEHLTREREFSEKCSEIESTNVARWMFGFLFIKQSIRLLDWLSFHEYNSNAIQQKKNTLNNIAQQV